MCVFSLAFLDKLEQKSVISPCVQNRCLAARTLATPESTLCKNVFVFQMKVFFRDLNAWLSVNYLSTASACDMQLSA